MPPTDSGGTGCTGAAIFTATSACPFRDAGSASNTRTAHNRSPVVLSRCCGSPTPAFTASKSLIGSTPNTYAPAGNTSSNRTGTGNCTATTTSRRVGVPAAGATLTIPASSGGLIRPILWGLMSQLSRT